MMKAIKLVKILGIAVLILSFNSYGQVLTNVEAVAPFNDGLAAIKKGKTWGFINTEGVLVIDYRNDVVATKSELPMFSNGLCLIKEMKNGIAYYGYINTMGEKVIQPEYLVATPFQNGVARVIKHYKQETSATNALGKRIVKYTYNELVINAQNEIVQHLRGPFNLLFDASRLKKNPPTITSKFISDDLVMVGNQDNTFSIYKLKQ